MQLSSNPDVITKMRECFMVFQTTGLKQALIDGQSSPSVLRQLTVVPFSVCIFRGRETRKHSSGWYNAGDL